MFFSEARRHLVDLMSPIRHRPDLAIEVLSPSTRDVDRGRKMAMFARYEVSEYWIVDGLTACIEVHHLANGGYVLFQVAGDDESLRSASLPDLMFRASEAFRIP